MRVLDHVVMGQEPSGAAVDSGADEGGPIARHTPQDEPCEQGRQPPVQDCRREHAVVRSEQEEHGVQWVQHVRVLCGEEADPAPVVRVPQERLGVAIDLAEPPADVRVVERQLVRAVTVLACVDGMVCARPPGRRSPGAHGDEQLAAEDVRQKERKLEQEQDQRGAEHGAPTQGCEVVHVRPPGPAWVEAPSSSDASGRMPAAGAAGGSPSSRAPSERRQQ